MKHILLLFFICSSILLSAKGFKINIKTVIKPYSIKIEKVENLGGKTLVYGEIKQQERFSYSVEFADCAVITSSNANGIAGELIEWNNNKKIPFTMKPISDKKEESFVLAFPEGSIPETGKFDLKIGTTQNKNRTELIIQNLTLQKK